MGRAAAKVETVEDTLKLLEKELGQVSADLRNYCGRASWGIQSPEGYRGEGATVVGHLAGGLPHVAKALQPERIKFWKRPSFDPQGFLDPENAAKYSRPLQFAQEPDLELRRPPPVRLRIAEKDKLRFLRLLDESGRLAFVRPSQARVGYENGAFAIPKDGERDRMILDARGPNLLEVAEARWIKSLASTQQLQHCFLADGERLQIFAEDLREFYHAFIISHERLRRNILKMTVKPSQVRDLGAYESWMEGEEYLYPALNTMPMGDCNAVAFGQASHLSVLL